MRHCPSYSFETVIRLSSATCMLFTYYVSVLQCLLHINLFICLNSTYAQVLVCTASGLLNIGYLGLLQGDT